LGEQAENQFTKLRLSLKRKFLKDLWKAIWCAYSSNGRDQGPL